MRKMKIVVSLLLVVALGLAGCGSSKKGDDQAKKKTLDGSKYVLIYNPLVYDEVEAQQSGLDSSSASTDLSTGDLSSQIEVSPNKAGDLKSKPKTSSVPQKNPLEITKGKKVKSKGKSKAGGLVKTYSVGDKEEFYYGMENTSRPKAKFDCMYAGIHCYVWGVNGSISTEIANECGKEFDEKIFENDTTSFGEGRFIEGGGKLNILCYPMQQNGLGGFFRQADLFTEEEATALLAGSGETIDSLGLNTDHAIVNVNSALIKVEPELVYSTVAHEYQHLVCASSCMMLMLTDSPVIRTWLNEAMSGIAEDINYEGVKTKDGTIPKYVVSQSQRRGQSLYNFKVDSSELNFDIGAYANVFEFAKYLKENGGDDVFSKIHMKAKEEGNTAMENYEKSDITEGDLLAQSVPSSFKNDIDKSYNFNKKISSAIGNKNEVWMSKLTLNYYLNLLQEDFDFSPSSITYPDGSLLYDTMESGNIEGGARILVKVSGDKFKIPEDADENLIYIGLDKDFKPITEVITKKTK